MLNVKEMKKETHCAKTIKLIKSQYSLLYF